MQETIGRFLRHTKDSRASKRPTEETMQVAYLYTQPLSLCSLYYHKVFVNRMSIPAPIRSGRPSELGPCLTQMNWVWSEEILARWSPNLVWGWCFACVASVRFLSYFLLLLYQQLFFLFSNITMHQLNKLNSIMS